MVRVLDVRLKSCRTLGKWTRTTCSTKMVVVGLSQIRKILH